MNRKVALITGSSRGIGKAIALRLAKESINIVVNYVRDKKSAELVAEDIRKFNCSALCIGADVSKFGDVKNMVAHAIEKFGRIDILVNNAGIYNRKPFDMLTPEDWERTIAVNLTGVYNCCKLVVPYMIKQRYGRIINISSNLAFTGSTHGADYSASKAGILGFTKSLARELGKYNICVNAITPGPTDTAIIASDTPERRRKRIEDTLLGRIGLPEDIANAVAFLVSDDANYITGQTLNVNGGIFLW